MPRHNFAIRFLACAALAGWLGPARAAEPDLLLDKAVTLPSTDTGWGGLAFDQAGNRLFLARGADGLTVFSTADQKPAATLDNSKGVTGVVLVPDADRLLAPAGDGTMLVAELSTLKVLDRVKVDEGALGPAFYEPSLKQVLVLAPNAKVPGWYAIDPASGKPGAHGAFEGGKPGGLAMDGKGKLFVPVPEAGLILRLAAADMKVEQSWKAGDCAEPRSVQYDRQAERLLVACVADKPGDKPVFVAMDPASGKVVATLPIGRGAGGMVVAERSHLIVIANGEDASFTLIQQDSPDVYRVVATIGTRPRLRNLAMDQATRRIFGVTADYTQPAAGADGMLPPVIYHPDSFTVLTYVPKK